MMKILQKKFEPSIVNKTYLIKCHLKNDWPDFKWHGFNKYDYSNFNVSVLRNIFGKLHYKCNHSTEQNRLKYLPAMTRFENHHFGDIYKMSVNFSNKYTANRFL